MSFYRNVDQRVWGDRKFRSLSANARLLWLYLLTGPHVGPVPGLSCVGRAGLAEALGWDLVAFDACFLEIASKGMAESDWDARVVWLPNAVKHNEPDSENNVAGWQRYLETLPDSDLTERATRTILEQAREMLTRRASEKAEERRKRGGAGPSAGPTGGPQGGPTGGPQGGPTGGPPPPPPAPPTGAGEGEGEGKGKEEEGSGEDSTGADAPAPPAAGGSEQGKRPRRTRKPRTLPPVVDELRAILGAHHPDAAWDELARRLDAGDLTPDDAIAIARWAVRDEFWSKPGPSTLYRPKHWPDLLGKARAGPSKPSGPPQPTIRKIKGVAEALAT